MSDLTFYTNPMSRGRIVRWMLEEVGAPYATHRVDFGAPDSAFLALNPMGKVPIVVHRGVVVTEAAAICAYLADAFPAAGLCPAPTAPERGPYLRWMFFSAGPLEAAVTEGALGHAPLPEQQAMVGYGSRERVFDALSSLLQQRDWVGENFSAADVHLGSQIAWGLEFATIDARPEFAADAARCTARPAAIRAREIDDAAAEAARG